jgi:hypothetical protein
VGKTERNGEHSKVRLSLYLRLFTILLAGGGGHRKEKTADAYSAYSCLVESTFPHDVMDGTNDVTSFLYHMERSLISQTFCMMSVEDFQMGGPRRGIIL